ncbi:hypothetical protein GCM10023114_58470 [Mycolicibacterium sediminis]|uniref:Uncharacterized protein n=3 Tax=Mycolicibacterium sediminis TaxID=1286180 RepID=A0A7I7QPG2_9MYCO|nr:hypothetical protein MSEDJ_22610 [Mycolicibacterium sediminis]
MPSRWERFAGVAPKIDTDREFLAFVAARHRGEPRLPHPDDLDMPAELRIRTGATALAWVSAAIVAVGLTGQPALAILGGALLACALVLLLTVTLSAGESISRYRDLRTRAVAYESQLRSGQLSTADSDTLNRMILCDEGTLSYCAAKIASEIARDPGWATDSAAFLPIDLWDELAEIGASARQIALDREAAEKPEGGRLRSDPDIRALITEAKSDRRTALSALAARVHGFADYRDRIQRLSARDVRDRGALERATRLASDEQARDRLT